MCVQRVRPRASSSAPRRVVMVRGGRGALEHHGRAGDDAADERGEADEAAGREAGRGAGAVGTAKLFRSGRAQLVHLPEGFRLEGDEVRIRRHGEAVVLEPIAADWDWLDALFGGLDEDFRRAAAEEPGDAPERPAVDRFFGR